MSAVKGNVLLADDDRVIQKMVGSYLEKLGYKVTVVNNGVEAMAKIRERIPTILLTDRNMPEMDGLELVKRLRAAHRTATLPIIIFSDLDKDDDAMLGYAAGADEYVPKPFTTQLLAVKIQSLLRRTEKTVAPTSDNRGKVIVFFHGKGGVGTTTLAANTAVALTLDSASTVGMMDFNTVFPNAAMYLNVTPKGVLADIEPAKLDQLTDEDFGRFVGVDAHGVQVVAASAMPEQDENVNRAVLEMAVERMRRVSDYVLIDCPADFGPRSLMALDIADLICLVTEPTLPAMNATKDCLRIFDALHIPPAKINVIFNQTGTQGAKEAEASKFLGGRKFDFSVPYSAQFEDAANSGVPVVDMAGMGAVGASLKALGEKVRAGVRAEA
jgi:pilus assembly protein CpaE